MKTMFVFRNVEDFASGAFENTAVDEGGIQLGRRGTGHLLEGSYTSQPFSVRPFRALIPSWNVDTPPGTSIELQVRVQIDGEWSTWFGFGHWSSFQHRKSPNLQQDNLVRVYSEWLQILPQKPLASAAQIRVYLHTQIEKKTPTIFLMAIGVLPGESFDEKEPFKERVLNIPRYSALVRDPAIARQMGNVTALTMLMNRWGADLLPEEVARATYDAGTQKYANLSFLSAVGGIYGYISYVGFGGLDALRREIWHGNGVAAQVWYHKEETTALPKPSDDDISSTHTSSFCPLWQEAAGDSNGHLLVVCGFLQRDGQEYVAVNNPMAQDNESVAQEIPLDLFRQMYCGIFVVLHRSNSKFIGYRPPRELIQLSVKEDEIEARQGDEVLIPGRFTLEENENNTLCFTLSSPVAYASAAQRQFYYLQADKEGRVKFDKTLAQGKWLTLYRIGLGGYTWVGEKWIGEKEKGAANNDHRTD